MPRAIMKQQAKERAWCFLKRKHDQGERKKGRMVMLLSRPTPPSSRASPVGRGPWAVGIVRTCGVVVTERQTQEGGKGLRV